MDAGKRGRVASLSGPSIRDHDQSQRYRHYSHPSA